MSSQQNGGTSTKTAKKHSNNPHLSLYSLPQLPHEITVVPHEQRVRLGADFGERLGEAHLVKVEFGVLGDAGEDIPPVSSTSRYELQVEG